MKKEITLTAEDFAHINNIGGSSPELAKQLLIGGGVHLHLASIYTTLIEKMRAYKGVTIQVGKLSILCQFCAENDISYSHFNISVQQHSKGFGIQITNRTGFKGNSGYKPIWNYIRYKELSYKQVLKHIEEMEVHISGNETWIPITR